MKKWLVGLLLLALALAAVGGWYGWQRWHQEAPDQAFLRATAAAALGDEAGFLDGFSKASRPLVAGLLALSRGDDLKTSSRHPYHWLLTEEVDSVEVQGDKAWVRVRRPGSSQLYDVPMVREEGLWAIDALAFDAKRQRGTAGDDKR